MMTLHPIAEEMLKVAGAAVVGYVLGVVFGVGKLREELAFIKGQLSQVMQRLGVVDKLKEQHAMLVKEQAKTRKDVDAAHTGIRELKASTPPSVQ